MQRIASTNPRPSGWKRDVAVPLDDQLEALPQGRLGSYRHSVSSISRATDLL